MEGEKWKFQLIAFPPLPSLINSQYIRTMVNFPVAFLDSNDGSSILAFGDGPVLNHGENVLEDMSQFVQTHRGSYIFSCLSYDIKNQVEDLTSNNDNRLGFPDAIFWVPKYVVLIDNNEVNFVQGQRNNESANFLNTVLSVKNQEKFPSVEFEMRARTSKENYLAHVSELQEHIQLGNIYEVNYCQEFYAEEVELQQPIEAYFKLNSITKAPYSSYFAFKEFYVLGGSPELYIQKTGDKISSSPIKGTRKRGKTPTEDGQLKKELFNDQKERSENVMIVDLVRNDLSKIATKGSVQVDELFGVYSFETVHQLISTISCRVDNSTSFTDILHASFPMGSMTGAPKISAMKLIEEHEEFKRGIYSGAIGLIKPNGDFIFNVVIRSLLYNSKEKYLSCPVGGAITINSIPEKEYEECLVKVQGILDQMNA